MKRSLDAFNRVARRIGPLLDKHNLEVLVGTWVNSSVLKVQRRSWTEAQRVPGSKHTGIFFSVWVTEQSLKKKQALYNIHALCLRSLPAYTLQSREFAAAFRAQFADQKNGWPGVSVEYGPQTLMQGWVPLDEKLFEKDVERLVRLFIPLADAIDALLEARKSV